MWEEYFLLVAAGIPGNLTPTCFVNPIKNIEAFMFVTLTSFGVCFSSRLTFSIVQHEAHCTL